MFGSRGYLYLFRVLPESAHPLDSAHQERSIPTGLRLIAQGFRTCLASSSYPLPSPLNLPLPSPVPLPLLPKATCFPVSLLENRPKVLAILDSEIGLEIASILTGQEPGFMGRDRERARGKTKTSL